MAQCADYPDDIPVAECIMAAEDAEYDAVAREVYSHFADSLQIAMPAPAPIWAVRLMFRWRMEAAR
jgi:hypothetical protein